MIIIITTIIIYDYKANVYFWGQYADVAVSLVRAGLVFKLFFSKYNGWITAFLVF
jgi:hypothetical protein